MKDGVKTWMYRAPGENITLVVTILILIGLGVALSTLDFYIVIGLVIIGLVYVRLTQVQYLGNAIRVHQNQFPEIWAVFKDYATSVNINKAALYIKQDPVINSFALGVTSCTVVVTSALVEQLSINELKFVLGHELGHYQAGHTRISSLIQPLGTGNVFANLIFGFWARKTEYSSDRCGLILNKNINHAITALIKTSLGAKLFEEFNTKGYISQIAKGRGKVFAASEILSDHPFTTNRVRKLLEFWEENFKNYEVS
jgi:Zn-dependent protease with chaperone function